MYSIRYLWRPSKRSNKGDRKQGAVFRMHKSFGMAKALRSKHRESWVSSRVDIHPASTDWQPWPWQCPQWFWCPLLVILGRQRGLGWRGKEVKIDNIVFLFTQVTSDLAWFKTRPRRRTWLSIRVRSALTSSYIYICIYIYIYVYIDHVTVSSDSDITVPGMWALFPRPSSNGNSHFEEVLWVFY